MGRYTALTNPLTANPGTTAPRNSSHYIPTLLLDTVLSRNCRSITLLGEVSSPVLVHSYDD